MLGAVCCADSIGRGFAADEDGLGALWMMVFVRWILGVEVPDCRAGCERRTRGLSDVVDEVALLSRTGEYTIV